MKIIIEINSIEEDAREKVQYLDDAYVSNKGLSIKIAGKSTRIRISDVRRYSGTFGVIKKYTLVT